jgi:hypothetical protein
MKIAQNISVLAVVFLMVAIFSAVAQEKQSTSKNETTVTGCLSGPNSEGAFVLKPSKGRAFEVGGNDQLKSHVGHTVKLTGNWAKSGAEIGENEAAEKNEKHETSEHRGVAERHFKVADIQHVSDTCSESGTMK